MNSPKTIEALVMEVLKERPETRDDDMKLYLYVCEKSNKNINIASIKSLPFAVVMMCYKELGLPHFESVRRSRAKIQASHKELEPSEECKRQRKKLERVCRNYFSKEGGDKK